MKKSKEQKDLERDARIYRNVSVREKSLLKERLITLYGSYVSSGHAVFTATLATFVSSRRFAKDVFPLFWNQEFIRRVKNRLPHKLRDKMDHFFVIEMTKSGHFHLHGLLAIVAAASHKVWRDGKLTPAVESDLRALASIDLRTHSFPQDGVLIPAVKRAVVGNSDREFAINSFLVEPLSEARGGIAAWANYITKDLAYISSDDDVSELLDLDTHRRAELDAIRSRSLFKVR